MFDTIKNELFCPYCGCKQKANDFQTKDFGKNMNVLDILEIRGINYEIYTTCINCNNWIVLHIPSTGINTVKEGQKQIMKKRKELARIFDRNEKKIKEEKKNVYIKTKYGII